MRKYPLTELIVQAFYRRFTVSEKMIKELIDNSELSKEEKEEEYRIIDEYKKIQLKEKTRNSKKRDKIQDINTDKLKPIIVRDDTGIIVSPPYLYGEWKPRLTIRNIDSFELALREYLDVIKNKKIKSTKFDERHNEKYFLFNIFKNATMEDFYNPEGFIKRYTNFIQDQTFQEYSQLTILGEYENNYIFTERIEDDYGFETPFVMKLSMTDGMDIYNFPWIRYGIAMKEKGEKEAFIYALQVKEDIASKEYRDMVRKILNKANSGVKTYRNVTPSSIVALCIFFGLLKNQNISKIKVPDFLVGRYGHFTNAKTDEETDRIQSNLTEKFTRSFLRLSKQIHGMEIESDIGDGRSSFMTITLSSDISIENELMREMYNLGYTPFCTQERGESRG